MAYDIAAPQFFDHTIKLPANEPGGERQSMHVTYKVVPDETAQMNMADTDAVMAFLHAAVHNISDLVTEDKQPIPFSAELLDQLGAATHLRMALANGYGFGIGKAAMGN